MDKIALIPGVTIPADGDSTASRPVGVDGKKTILSNLTATAARALPWQSRVIRVADVRLPQHTG